MHQRCYNPNHRDFKHYGGRGIQVCLRWHESNPNGYRNFLSDMERRPSPELSLDRIDNDRGYMPSNCRWATILQQNNNKRH
jgi:hypothetical protein